MGKMMMKKAVIFCYFILICAILIPEMDTISAKYQFDKRAIFFPVIPVPSRQQKLFQAVKASKALQGSRLLGIRSAAQGTRHRSSRSSGLVLNPR